MYTLFPDWIVLAVFLVLYLISRTCQAKQTVFVRIFREFLVVSILELILECFALLAANGSFSLTAYRILTTFYCASKPLLFALWVCFAIFRCYAPDMKPITRQMRHTFIFYGQFLLLVMTNKFTGLFFVIDEDRIIRYGMLYLPLLIGLPLVFSVYGLAVTWLFAEKKPPVLSLAGLIILFTLPLAGVLLQHLRGGWPFISVMEAVSYSMFLYTLMAERQNSGGENHG